MMANVILKSLKFTKILNGRLSFSSLKPYYANGRYIIRSYKETRHSKAYATAAYKLEPNEDLVVKNNVTSTNMITKESFSIDDYLAKIDSLIRRTGRTQMKNVYNAFSSITDKEMASSTHALYLIRSCKYCCDEPPPNRIELVNQIWNRFQELGIEFDVRHYNSLLDVHISNGFNFNPAEFLASMEDINIQPNKNTYLLILKKYCQDGNIDGASEILQYMKKEGLSADEKVFNYLIEGHIRNNDFTGAKDMIEVMRSSNLQPNADTYNTLACGYAAIGEKNKMMSCLSECSHENSTQNYLKVIDVLATSGNHELIDEVLSLIQHKENYRDEFINAAVELIHKDQIDIAYQLILETYSPRNNESMNIFIKQLVRGQKPISKINYFCKRIFDENLNKNIYLIAVKVAAENGLIDYTFSLAKRMIELGIYVRCSTLWPLFTSSKDIWLILKKMTELGIPADYSTYLETIYPALGVPEPKNIIDNVKASGQIVETAADALFVYYCHLGEIDYATDLTQMLPVTFGDKFDAELFLSKCINLNKESLNKYLKLLRYIFMEVDINARHIVIQGKLLAELVKKKVNILETLLKNYEDLSFNPRSLDICEQEIMNKNPRRQAFVKKLRSLSITRGNMFMKENLSIQDENKCISHLQAQNIPCGPFLAKRILYHIRQKNVARVSELLSLFEELNLTYSPLIFANLMSMYSMAGDIEKAIEAANKLKTEFPDFKLDLSKTFDYVTYLTRYEKFDECFDAFKYFFNESYNYTNKDMVLRNIKRFIGILSEVNDIEFVKKMHKLIFPLSEEFGSRAVFLEPLIQYHLKRGDLTSAINEFNNVVMKHHVPACLNSLLKKCINLDDKNTLQKVIDTAMGCSRKANVLLELAVAFIETYNTQKAKKIIENLDREINRKDLEDMCLKLCHENKHVELEQLIFITRCLNHVNREDLYMCVFKAYANKNDTKRVKKLFAALKEEISELKSETIDYVQNLLRISSQSDNGKVIFETSETIPSDAKEATKTFIEHLEARNAKEALKELTSLKKGYIRTLPLKTLTDLVDLCLQENCTSDLSLNVHAMSYIIENTKDVLKPLLEKYSEAGDIEKFVAISHFLPDFTLMNIGLNSYFCKAFIVSGKHEELLSHLEQRVDKKNKLFSRFAFEELLKFPQYEDRIFNLAVKYFELNYHTPMAVVWAHYFLKENFEKADEIFKKYSFQLDKLDVVLNIRQRENATVALKYVDFIKPLTVRLRMKQRAYGTALELLVAKEMYDEAADLVVESEKLNLLLHKYYMTPLITLKTALEKENRSVPFNIPVDAGSNSS